METTNLAVQFPLPQPAVGSHESLARNMGGTGHRSLRDGRDPPGVRVLRP